MDICNEVICMRENKIWNTAYTQAMKLYSLIAKALSRNSASAARRELAALSPWLKKDLGIGHDGRPLDRKS